MAKKKNTNKPESTKDKQAESVIDTYECSDCGADEYEIVGEAVAADYGLIVHGIEYKKLIRHFVKCKCGQYGILRSFAN